MAHVRARRLKTGVFWYMVPDDRAARPEPCGPGRAGEILAKRWAAKVNELKYAARAGLLPPQRCAWTLAQLREVDLEDARRRGLRTSQPQRQGRLSKRESHWNSLLGFFGAELRLEDLDQAAARAFVAERLKQAGPAAVNRDLDVLRRALRLARELEESGYRGDPLAKLPRLAEDGRAAIALSAGELARLLRIAYRLSRPFGAYLELLAATASRLNEAPIVDGRLLRYPAYKRGRARAFRIRGRLLEVLQEPRAFSRRLWTRAAKAIGKDELRPHDLRHTALTLAGKRPGVTLLELQRLGGWRDPRMAARYLHPGAEALDALEPAGTQRARRRAG